MKKHLLMILDGYGLAEDPSVSAIDAARKPFLDSLFSTYPHGTLDASGLAVGLPEGQMGNSEVGHMNLGAGRVVYQDITRIDKTIQDREFDTNAVLRSGIEQVRRSGKTLHLMGLLSDGGVHSSQAHLHALIRLAATMGLRGGQVVVHAFMDGRDTSPHGGAAYLEDLESVLNGTGCGVIGSVVGRYWAMDRDNRWPRIEKAYRLLTEGKGERYTRAVEAIRASYAAGVTDEFVEPCCIGDPASHRITDGDVVLFFNFRADRARQISRALTDPAFDGFDRTMPANLHYITFTPYDESLDFEIVFPKVNLTETLGEVIARAGGRQLRAAETEKYPHVTYFFSGGREDPFEGEDRILVASPKVATYDLQPEMSAPELAEKVAAAVRDNDYTFVCINFANPDMVGHTGVFEAAVKAIEAVDKAAKVVVDAALASGYSINIIADHGNADRMRNPDGSPHTAHTTVPVPHLIIKDGFQGPVGHGKLGDVAPTILHILGIDQPRAMTGASVIKL
ncbi:MAG: 2,3-bisphosphoglycerate-independent phosphoglycerate mutase [Bacteroidetes bacterium]|nr:2,3-bisphosphoglycerate-independent phosphoglycerate mutase [Bacteroidota bacterium]MDA0874445.1 2,3-bisphosphoglycerate-independent phosphoglycerate mutase [Bacteroidota bacterium]